ncbi:unnamed protein product, partial [Prunus brigantina]
MKTKFKLRNPFNLKPSCSLLLFHPSPLSPPPPPPYHCFGFQPIPLKHPFLSLILLLFHLFWEAQAKEAYVGRRHNSSKSLYPWESASNYVTLWYSFSS